MFYRKEKLRFQCTGCGMCCMGNNDDDYIAADSHEQERIRAFLGVTQQWFRRRYIVAVDHGTQGIRINNSGRCAFLDRANRCRIYAVRPRQCRAYPFWPEVLANRSAWQAEARQCEGIGRGTVIPLTRIKHALKASGD